MHNSQTKRATMKEKLKVTDFQGFEVQNDNNPGRLFDDEPCVLRCVAKSPQTLDLKQKQSFSETKQQM